METLTREEFREKQAITKAENILKLYNPDFVYSLDHDLEIVRVIGIDPDTIDLGDREKLLDLNFFKDDETYYSYEIYMEEN